MTYQRRQFLKLGALLGAGVALRPLAGCYSGQKATGGEGNLDSALTHVLALLVFVTGLLTGGLHLHLPLHRQRRA